MFFSGMKLTGSNSNTRVYGRTALREANDPVALPKATPSAGGESTVGEVELTESDAVVRVVGPGSGKGTHGGEGEVKGWGHEAK